MRMINNNVTSLYGSSCANKGKGALNTPDNENDKHAFKWRLHVVALAGALLRPRHGDLLPA
eukprot:5419816-Pyramimonas_sp.AAC.1